MEARTSTSSHQLIKSIIDAENAYDVDRLTALMTDDVMIEYKAFGMVMKGKEAVRQGCSTLFAAIPDFKRELKSGVSNEKSFAFEWTISATQKGGLPGIPATDKHFSIRGCNFGEFENGKLKSRRDYWDLASMAKQLGM